MSEGLGYFTAVYRDGRVHIGNKSYAAGVYAVHLLNQYYKNDTAARIAVYKQYILQVRRQLEIGYLNESDFEKAGEEIQSILNTLPKLKPFDILDIESEKKRISELFTKENAAYITDCFSRKGAISKMDKGAAILGVLPPAYDKELFKKCETMSATVLPTLCFYDSVSEDMRTIERIANEVGMEYKTVKQYLMIGVLNERRADFYMDYDEDGEETDEDVTVDYSSEPDKLYFRTVLNNSLYSAYDKLSYREQHTLAKHLGFCNNWWSTKKAILKNGEVEYIPIKPMTFEEISHSASRKSDKASERTFYTALEKMKKHIEKIRITVIFSDK